MRVSEYMMVKRRERVELKGKKREESERMDVLWITKKPIHDDDEEARKGGKEEI